MEIKISDLIESKTILSSDNINGNDFIEISLFLKFKCDDFGENSRKIGLVLSQLVEKYKGEYSKCAQFYMETGDEFGRYKYDCDKVTCTFSGPNYKVNSEFFLLELNDLTYNPDRKYPIKVYFLDERGNLGYRVQISIYNTITEELCEEINSSIKEFNGKEIHSFKAKPHNYCSPDPLNIYFSSRDAAWWFYKSIKMIEENN
jgi:hypothetical protein